MIARSVLLQMANNKSVESFARHNPQAAECGKTLYRRGNPCADH